MPAIEVMGLPPGYQSDEVDSSGEFSVEFEISDERRAIFDLHIDQLTQYFENLESFSGEADLQLVVIAGSHTFEGRFKLFFNERVDLARLYLEIELVAPQLAQQLAGSEKITWIFRSRAEFDEEKIRTTTN